MNTQTAAKNVLAIELVGRPNGRSTAGRDASPVRAMSVESPAFSNGQKIPERHSEYGDRVSPELRWTGTPEQAKSLVLMMEDPDAPEPKPFVHWLMYNIPPQLIALPEGLHLEPQLPDLGGALQGRNSTGSFGYFGPRPPKGDPPHHYHFQLFALSEAIALSAGADRAELLNAIKGHVIAKGELVGTYQAPNG